MMKYMISHGVLISSYSMSMNESVVLGDDDDNGHDDMSQRANEAVTLEPHTSPSSRYMLWEFEIFEQNKNNDS